MVEDKSENTAYSTFIAIRNGSRMGVNKSNPNLPPAPAFEPNQLPPATAFTRHRCSRRATRENRSAPRHCLSSGDEWAGGRCRCGRVLVSGRTSCSSRKCCVCSPATCASGSRASRTSWTSVNSRTHTRICVHRERAARQQLVSTTRGRSAAASRTWTSSSRASIWRTRAPISPRVWLYKPPRVIVHSISNISTAAAPSEYSSTKRSQIKFSRWFFAIFWCFHWHLF